MGKVTPDEDKKNRFAAGIVEYAGSRLGLQLLGEQLTHV
jgi:hypothetical protein